MDVVGDFLTRIRNGVMAKHDRIDLPSSNLRSAMAEVLKSEGYIRDFRVVKDGRQGMMRIYLQYGVKGTAPIRALERVSRPGRRQYSGIGKMQPVRNGFGIAILSTNKGIMSDRQAKLQNVGGEILCKVW